MPRFASSLSLLVVTLALAVPSLAQCNLNGCAGTPPCSYYACNQPLGGCAAPTAVTHARALPCSGGSFDLRGTVYERSCARAGACFDPPPLRFWAYDDYAGANYGCGWPGPPGSEWMLNAGVDLALGSPGQWLLYQTNWMSCSVEGCPAGRTVAEVSDVDHLAEGTPGHDAWYLVASVDIAPGYFDFDRVRGGDRGLPAGCGPASPRVTRVPATVLPGARCPDNGDLLSGESNANPGFYDVDVWVGPSRLQYFTESGRNDAAVPLIAGLQLVYQSGTTAPLTSRGSAWLPARDPLNPADSVAAVVPLGPDRLVTVALPRASAPHWLASRVIYQDRTLNPVGAVADVRAPRLMTDVGRSCGPIGPPVTTEVCAVGTLNPIDQLIGVRDGAAATFRWIGDAGAGEYHLNLLTDKRSIDTDAAHQAPLGSAVAACEAPAPATACSDVDAIGDARPFLLYQAVAACGVGGLNEGPAN